MTIAKSVHVVQHVFVEDAAMFHAIGAKQVLDVEQVCSNDEIVIVIIHCKRLLAIDLSDIHEVVVDRAKDCQEYPSK